MYPPFSCSRMSFSAVIASIRLPSSTSTTWNAACGGTASSCPTASGVAANWSTIASIGASVSTSA
jgi:hypothetical protein